MNEYTHNTSVQIAKSASQTFSQEIYEKEMHLVFVEMLYIMLFLKERMFIHAHKHNTSLYSKLHPKQACISRYDLELETILQAI